MESGETLQEAVVVEIDTKDLREIVLFAIALGKAMENTEADGKIDMNDMIYILPVLTKVGAAFDGIGNVPAILKGMSKEQAQALLEEINKELDLTNDKLESMIKDSLAIVLSIYTFYKTYFVKATEADAV